MLQKYSSAKTSINKNKLPKSTKTVPFYFYSNQKVLDIGGGKFDNLKDYLKANFNIDLFIYDKYNRDQQQNETALNCNPTIIICNNVLNVIDNEEVIQDVANFIQSYNVPYFISIYEGNRTGTGKATGCDQYQRNETLKSYLKYFPKATICKGLIVGLKNPKKIF